MVKRKENTGEKIEQFEGEVETVTLVDDELSGKPQYHMIIKPLDEETIDKVSESKTQRLHNFIGVSATTTDTEIAEGSNLDRFIQEVEACFPETKELETLLELAEKNSIGVPREEQQRIHERLSELKALVPEKG